MPGATRRPIRRDAHDDVKLNGNTSSYGCQTWSAIVFSTPVKDTDKDGLVDRLETAPTGGISSFQGSQRRSPTRRCGRWAPALGPRDLFVEINSFHANPNTTYGSSQHPFPLPGQDLDGDGRVTDTQGHDHRPLPTTLTLVGDALFRAGVRVHFDVGPLEGGGSGYSVNGAFHPFPDATPGDTVVPLYPDPSTYFIDEAPPVASRSSRRRA